MNELERLWHKIRVSIFRRVTQNGTGTTSEPMGTRGHEKGHSVNEMQERNLRQGECGYEEK